MDREIKHDVAFVSLNDRQVLVGFGPFTRAAERIPGKTAFYITDFFQEQPEPWLHPESVVVYSNEEFVKLLTTGTARTGKVVWEQAERAPFETVFAEIMRLIRQRTLAKAVVVTRVEGAMPEQWQENRLRAVLQGVASLYAPGLLFYGYQIGERGCVGLTPETLFHRCGNGVESLALAGTAPHSEDVSLSSNPKELSEHAFVRRDIAERLSPFGTVEVGSLSVQPFGHVFHLHSPICLTLNRPATFTDLVSALHPTAALGTYPRSPEGAVFLHFQETYVPRGLHGAPFGVEWEERDGTRAKALVAIRNLQWEGNRIIAVSGAGVVRESSADNEWRECQLKRAHLMAAV